MKILIPLLLLGLAANTSGAQPTARTAPPPAPPPTIGIYFHPTPNPAEAILGYEGIKMALEENGFEESVGYVDRLEAASLAGLKVLILPRTHAFPRERPESAIRAALRAFVEKGGGLLLVNESVGWRRIFAAEPPFPEIGRGVGTGDTYQNSVSGGVGPMTIKYVTLAVEPAPHPVTSGLPKEFRALHDLPDLQPGPAGRILARRNGGGAALVAGTIGKGRVLLAAPALGLGERNLEEPPNGAALKLLLNGVRWLAGTE
ncbi:MAG TPA: hypothetical protein PKN80_03435 [bacterium]|nr:hypothetical protein [bacterium]HNS48812.1 hypothetical protein [bacterium]